MRQRAPHPPIAAAGYTLVEVLTVCAIIAILAAMAFPSMVQAIKNARRTKCANNLRQIGIAFAGFAHDHGDRYPQQVPIAEGGSREQNLQAPVLNGQYILSPLAFVAASAGFQSAQVMVCPATRLWVPSFAALQVSNLCYALNLQAEPGSSAVALAADSHLLGDWRTLNRNTVDMGQGQVLFASTRHDNKGNVLFGDGHVELLKGVASTPAQLAAAARTVASVQGPRPEEGARASRLPTEKERQAAYQAAHPDPAPQDFGAVEVPSAGTQRTPGAEGLSLAEPSTRRGGTNGIRRPVAGMPAPAEELASSPALSPTETRLRRSLLWLWLILFLLGLALLARHLHREKQRRRERQQRWAAYAAEQEALRTRRQAPRVNPTPGRP